MGVGEAEGGTFVRAKLESDCGGSGGGSIEEVRKVVFVTGDEDEVIGVGEDGDGDIVVFGWSSGQCFGCVFDLAEYKFEGEIEEDGTEGASLFDTRFDRYFCGYSVGGSNCCGGISIGVSDEVDQSVRHTEVEEGCEDRCMGDTTKGVAQVQPGEKDILLESARVAN